MKPLALVVALAVVLGVLFVLFKPSASRDMPPSSALAKSGAPADAASSTTAAREPAVPVAPVAASKGDAERAAPAHTIDLTFRHGVLASGPTITRVAQGDRVLLRATADTVDELHLHGYNLTLHLRPANPRRSRSQ